MAAAVLSALRKFQALVVEKQVPRLRLPHHAWRRDGAPKRFARDDNSGLWVVECLVVKPDISRCVMWEKQPRVPFGYAQARLFRPLLRFGSSG